MPRFLVTGGCGFIGSHLTEALLADGHQVSVLDDLSTGTTDNLPAGAALLRGDVADPVAVTEALRGMTGCFHLAAIASVQRSAEDLLGTHRTNLGGTLTLFDAIGRLASPIPVVYASSAAVYGECDTLPITENAPARPRSAYGADKRACELHAAVASYVHAVPTTGLRFFNVYGPRQRWDSPYSGVVSIFAQRIAQNQGVTVFGDGEQTRDLIHVFDVVTALRRAMQLRLPGAPVFNVCTGQPASVLQLIHIIGALHGREPEVTFAPARTGDIRHSVGNPTRGRAALGLSEPRGLADGLASLLGVQSQAAANVTKANPIAQARR